MRNLKFLISGLISVCSFVSYCQTGSTSVGSGAGKSGYSSIFGYQAGNKISSSSSSSWNSFFGAYSGYNVPANSGTRNSFFGYYTGYANTSGWLNSFFGYYSGRSNTTGSSNTFIGSFSGYNHLTGEGNVFVGNSAGYSYLSDTYNTIIGPLAGYNKESGTQNVIIGFRAANNNVSASNLTIIGSSSLYSNTTGTKNTTLGYQTGYKNVTGSGNIFLGYMAGYNETESNKLYIENSSSSNALIKGDFSTNQVGINASSLVEGFALTVGGSLYTAGNLRVQSSGYFDDDPTFGEHNDDWMRLHGYIEFKSNTDSYGVVLRDKDNNDYLGLTQRNGWSYFSDTQPNNTGYFLRGNASDVEIPGTLKVGGKLIEVDNWNTAFGQRGSVISGNGLKWENGKLNVVESALDATQVNYFLKSGNNVSYTQGLVGLGTNSPKSTLHVVGEVTDPTPNVEGTQIRSGIIELTRDGITPHIDFQNDIEGTDFDARIVLEGNDYLRIAGAHLRLGDFELRQVRGVQLRDWDDDTGGDNNKYRLFGRDGAWMFYDGGVAIGQFPNSSWTDLSNGSLIVQNSIGIGRTSAEYSLDVNGDIMARDGWIRSTGDRGLHNNTDGTYLYSDDVNYWRMRSDRGLVIANRSNTRKGVLYHDNGNGFGLLDGDGQWGLRLQKDSYTAFLINNNEKMRIHANGKVGIGITSDPSSKLHVNGVITATDGNSTQWNTAYKERGSQLAGTGLSFAAGKLNLSLGAQDWAFNNNNLTGVNNLAINDPGSNEGITWTGTGAKIFVSPRDGGTTDGFLRLINDGGISIEAGVENREDVIISSSGNVGIGVNPASKLHVNGALRGNQSGAIRIATPSGYTDVGAKNESWSHFFTDRPRFFFNKGITVDEGLVGSHNEDLRLQSAGITGLSISNTNQNVSVHQSLIVDGDLKLNPDRILLDNDPEDLLVMKGDGTVAKRSVSSIESPWLLELMGQDTVMSTGDDSGVPIIVDVFDLNGNLRIGDNSYIDDDLTYGDNGESGNIPDDWMRFADRIEFKSSDDKFGIVLYDKNDYLDYLNLHQEDGITYLSNGDDSDGYFLKANGRNVEFGGDVLIHSINASEHASNTSLKMIIDRDDNSDAADSFIIGANGSADDPSYKELMRLDENGLLYLSGLSGTIDADLPVLVKDEITGEVQTITSSLLGPWKAESTNNLVYDLGNVGIGVSKPTVALDVDGEIKFRGLSSSNTSSDIIVSDGTGQLYKRSLSTLSLSPWTDGDSYLQYSGGVKVGNIESNTGFLNVYGTISANSLSVTGLAENSSSSQILVANDVGLLGTMDVSSLVGEQNNSLTRMVAVDNDGNLHYRSINSIVGNELITSDDLVVKAANGSLRTRSVSSLIVGEDPDGVDIVVKSSDGSLNTRALSTINLSPWEEDASTLSYGGDVGIGLGGNLPTQSLDLGGSARFRGVMEDDMQGNFLVINENGVIKKRGLNSFSPWIASNANSFYSQKKFGVGIENLSSDNSVIISSDVRKALVVESTYDYEHGYGVRTDVTRDDAKAFAVYRTDTGSDVYRVFGDGVVEAKEVLVSLDVWNDKVFKDGYQLMPLDKVEEYVNENHHLPEIPSEEEVLKDGVHLGEMEALLLKKIEELTLYIIEQKKQLQEQGDRIKELEEKLD